MTVLTPLEFWTLNNTRVGAIAGNTLNSAEGVDRFFAGVIGQGWQVSKTLNRVLYPSNPSIFNRGATPWAISQWIYPTDALQSSQYTLYSTATEGNGKLSSRIVTSSGKHRWSVNGSAIDSLAAVIFNAWNHICLVNDVTGFRLYLNGVKRVASLAQPDVWTNFNIAIGGYAGAGMSGGHDALGVWDSALSDAEVAELYNDGAGWEYSTPADNTPDAFDFADVSDADPATVYVSDSQTITGMDAGTAISVSGCEYSLDGGAWTSGAGTIDPGQGLRLRATSSAESEGVVTVGVTVGTVTVDWTITTGVLSSAVCNLVGSAILQSRIFKSRIVAGHV